jgi:Short C-terminal domain
MPPTYTHVPPTYTPGMPPSQPSAMEILRQRYARGEIDTATYESMRERLENSGGPGPQ